MLRIKAMGIDTYKENILYLRHDSDICRSEGFSALTRVTVHYGEKSIIATINAVTSNILSHSEAGLSHMAFEALGANEGEPVSISFLKPVSSLSYVRAKLYGKDLDEAAFREIISDITAGRYSGIELSAFIAACAGDNLELDEVIFLTKSMIDSGNKINWNKPVVPDKHSIGGLPGNRTTPIIVAIAAAAGLTIPKTSSHAITSPAGTADTMATLTRVDLTLEQIREVVEKESGCLAWGGSMQLSPADDILITVERALDLDSSGQMIASVLSKKAAAGSTHVLIEIPVGETAKVRLDHEALKLKYYFEAVAHAINLRVRVLLTPGHEPVGRGIGPSLEAIDVLKVLRNDADAPADLRNKAVEMASILFEMSGVVAEAGEEHKLASFLLSSGAAYKKFVRICEAQGGFKEPVLGEYSRDIACKATGILSYIDNRKLARVAKLAGAPDDPSAGVLMHKKLGEEVAAGETLFTIYSESEGELQYALEFYNDSNNIFKFS